MNAPEVIIPTTAGAPFGGGIYAGRFILGTQAYALIVAPADGSELEATPWGGTKKVAAAASYADGFANTEAMAKAGSAAAKWARDLRIDGLDDWYLPSRLEALVMFGELEKSDEFTRAWYWTSTQYAGDDAYAWYQSFGYGTQGDHRKDDELRARAVRRFPIRQFIHSVIRRAHGRRKVLAAHHPHQ